MTRHMIKNTVIGTASNFFLSHRTKRLFVLTAALILFSLLPFSVFAADVTVSASDEPIKFDTSEYLPDDIKDILSGSGLDGEDSITPENIFRYIAGVTAPIVKGYSGDITVIIGIVLLSAASDVLLCGSPVKNTASYVIKLSLVSVFIDIYADLSVEVSDTVRALSDILGAVLPSFTGVLLLGGSTFSAAASSASFGAVLLLLEEVLKKLFLPLTHLLVMMLMLENLSPQFSGLDVVKVFKKHLLSFFSFSTAMFLTLLSYQSVIASAKDSASAKTVKFLASGFIPVIGGALGESMKTVSAGLKLLKVSVGQAVSVSLFFTVFPVLAGIFVIKTGLWISELVAGLTGSNETKAFFESSVSMLDILNAIIICIGLLSLLLVISFSLSATSLGV